MVRRRAMSLKASDYRADIDGLRAVAVLSVLGFHAFPSLFPGGFVGVDVFFVISGYLITRILRDEMQHGGIRIGDFYARRVLRIFPALLVVLAACILTGWYTLLAGEYQQLGKHVAAGASFLSNLALWQEAGYFDVLSEKKPLLHLWSLGIEEQFYIAWPLVLWWFSKRRFMPVWITGLALASLAFSVFEVGHDRTQAFYSPLSRAWELLVGAMLAFGVFGQALASPRALRLQLPCWGLALIAVSVFALRAHDPFPGLLALLPVLGAALVIAPSTRNPGMKLLSNRVMVSIGKISYCLYLWHWPLLSFARIFGNAEPTWPVRTGLLAASFLLATLTYWLIEKPVRKLPRRWAVTGLLAGMVFVALLGKNIYDREGLERIRYKTMFTVDADAARDFVDWEKTGLITDFDCKRPFLFPERQYCLTQHLDRPVTAAVIGDSHAFHAYWGLAQSLDARGDNLTAIGRGACVPFLGYVRGQDPDKCQPHIDAMLHYAAETPGIHRVLLVFRGRYLPNDAPPENVKSFADALDRTLKLLLSSHKSVSYFLPVVEAGFDPRLCIGQLPLGREAPVACEISRRADSDASALMRSTVLQVLQHYPQVQVIDPNDALCDDRVCPMVRDGHSMFKDQNHLSYSGSMLVGRHIAWDEVLSAR